LNEKTNLNYRLPTEAEWEYAARSGGKKQKWSGINNESELGEYAWYADNSGRKTHPVGQKKPNGLSLYDMSGNVYEWCSDWYGKDYYKNNPRSNPKGPSSGHRKMIHGGSWFNIPWAIRASDRIHFNPDVRHSYFLTGFRLAVSASDSDGHESKLSKKPNSKEKHEVQTSVTIPSHINLR